MNFFDKHPVCHPWPSILRQRWFAYKPREVWWQKKLGELGLRRGDKVLEVGCGEGILLDQLKKKYGIKGYGLDASSVAITKAKTNSSNQYLLGDATKLPFDDHTFDVVLSFDTLEHVSNQEKMVSEMIRVLKPGGKILIYTINSRQRFTWNWFLDKLGINIYKNVNHNPKLFVDPNWLKKKLDDRRVRVLGLDYFNAFFSLVIDEIVMVFLETWQKILSWEKTKKFANIILGLLTIIAVVLTPFLRVLEIPWRIFGYSNGFLILGEKKK